MFESTRATIPRSVIATASIAFFSHHSFYIDDSVLDKKTSNTLNEIMRYNSDFGDSSNTENIANEEFHRLIGEITHYSQLPDDWDGYDGVGASFPMASSAKILLSKLNFLGVNLPKPMITGAGDICLYWKFNGNCQYVEISLDGGGTYSYFYKENDRYYGEEDISISNNIPDALLTRIGLPKKPLVIEHDKESNVMLIGNSSLAPSPTADQLSFV